MHTNTVMITIHYMFVFVNIYNSISEKKILMIRKLTLHINIPEACSAQAGPSTDKTEKPPEHQDNYEVGHVHPSRRPGFILTSLPFR